MRTAFKSLLVTGFVAMMSLTAQASDTILSDGIYATPGESHYKDNQISLQAWGDGYTMTAVLMRDGREYEVEAFLRPVRNNEFAGSGTITVRYSDTTGCRHRFGTKFFVTDAGLYLRENTPRNIPFNPNGPCTAAGPYVWFNHPAPYALQD